ncbi:MAG: Hsp20/alpha crystallin family protein [Candidatus Nanoarchaeia archaeon]|nr:Hsp20/alpha crystallin family protein [Candidatus Nanoarchaeia archaeon]
MFDDLFSDFEKEFKRMKEEMANMRKRFNEQMGKTLKDLKTGIRLPRVHTQDMGNRYVVKVELPGIKKEEVMLYINEKSMELEATARKVAEKVGKQMHETKAMVNKFRKMMTFPEEVDAKSVKTRLENGILEIIVSKKYPMPTKTIKTKTIRAKKKIAVKPSKSRKKSKK